jgi:hypothetical protein
MTEETKTPAPGSFAHLMSPPQSEEDKVHAKKAVRKAPKQKDKPKMRTDSTSVRTDVLAQIPPTPERRRSERYAFQFWADQVTRLKKLKQVLNLTNDPEDRREITLSDMIRQAVDDYLDKQIKHISQHVRSYE